MMGVLRELGELGESGKDVKLISNCNKHVDVLSARLEIMF